MNVPRDLLRRRILLVDIEPATALLFTEWLDAAGLAADTDSARTEPPVALALLELPFPRRDIDLQRTRLAHRARAWPNAPLVVLSPTLLPGVAPRGEVARALGVAAVLPSPLSRDLLCDTIGALVNV